MFRPSMPSRARRLAPAALVALTAVLALAAAGRGRPQLDDFEDRDLEAANGSGWIVIADDQLGGTSRGRLEVIAEGAGGSRGALRFEAETAAGFAVPFAGAWTAVDGDGLPADLSAYRGLRFSVRGDGAAFLVGARRGSGGQAANFMTQAESTTAWRRVAVPFSDLRPSPPAPADSAWHAGDVGWIGFTTVPGTLGTFHLEIDDVELY